jgi:glycosyltransferase involved in cell wall biosynthesis
MPNLDRAQKIAFLQSLSVFSVPATYGESFGLYVLEAMACGVPVVQPRHGPFPELIEATGGGVLCAPDDPADLAAKLEELLADDARRTALGEAGRAKVLAHFTVERMAREVAGVLERARA